jgi:hypothetical protein
MANVNHGDIIDYAMPLMQIERLLRQIHEHCLKREFLPANTLCPEVITEVRVLSASLALMASVKEQEK